MNGEAAQKARKKVLAFARRGGQVTVYLLPCLVALLVLALFSMNRSSEVARQIDAHMRGAAPPKPEKGEKGADPACSEAALKRQLYDLGTAVRDGGVDGGTRYVLLADGQRPYRACSPFSGALDPAVAPPEPAPPAAKPAAGQRREVRIDCVLHRAWLGDVLVVFGLTLLPFGLVAFSLSVSRGIRKKLRDINGWTEDQAEDEIWRLARASFFMKYVLATACGAGILYVLRPFGIGASAVHDFVTSENSVSFDTLPLFTHLGCSPIKSILSGILGWYILLVGTFAYKAYRADVMSGGFCVLFFRRLLVVLVLGIVGPLVSKDLSLVAIFTVAVMPFPVTSLLKEAGLKLTAGATDSSAQLLKLPGLHRWECFRLEEDGIESPQQLATADRTALKRWLPYGNQVIDLWISAAVLMVVVGDEQYDKLRKTCMTAEEFLRRLASDEKTFAAELKSSCGIENAQEIANLLRKRFSIEAEPPVPGPKGPEPSRPAPVTG